MAKPEGKYAWTATVGEKGQIVIPKQARELFDIKPGDTLLLLGDEPFNLGCRGGCRGIEGSACGSDGRRFVTERRTRMGVLAIGYADGLPRILSNRCSFAAGEGFAPQCGSICMDMCMVDLTDRPEVRVGSEVEIFGERSDLNLLSETAGTIPYELLCAINKRVPRVYLT